MRDNSLSKEIPGLVLTAARYGMATRMARKVRNDEPIGADMVALIAADVADGVVFRRFDMDTPLRRVADGVVDHLSVARVAYETWQKSSTARSYIGVLAARAALVGGANLLQGEITRGGTSQRATHLAAAAFALAAHSDNRDITHLTGTIASGIAVGTAVLHFKDIGKSHPSGIRKL